MRLQLAHSDLKILSPEAYNQLFTMHGFTMIFLYAGPVLSGFSNYLWPLLLGSRDMAFPRLNALSYWIFLLAGLFSLCELPARPCAQCRLVQLPAALGKDYNPGPNIDFYLVGSHFPWNLDHGRRGEFPGEPAAHTRARHVDQSPADPRVGYLTASVGNLLAVPAVSLACVLLFTDRQFGTHFFDVEAHGQPLLWQHLFWMFGHPWVYAIVLPALGIVSDALPTFCRRPLVGYTPVALATVATMIVGFGVWLHHMFATGMPMLSLAFFSAASLVITIPSAVSTFAWIATIWTGKPVLTTPFLFLSSFIILFVIGGVSGVMTGAVPFDFQLTDTYFVVAHLHYVLIGINVFPVIGGIYYWFPKMTGRMMSERLGRWNFWTMFLGFNIGFFPMHIVGLMGMPRRIYTYAPGLGWDTINLITTDRSVSPSRSASCCS
jgi:heme/copper-type cytochrome/quinol oxidase subunit 1